MAAICMRYTRNEQDAIEILNDGFLKVFKNIHLFDVAKASLYTWIRTIVINSSIDFLRKRKLAFTEMSAEGPEESAVPNEAIQKLDAVELLKLVRQLPPATQLVFNLYTVDGYTHVEIAKQLQISEGTSKWHLSEARRLLKKSLQAITHA